MIDCNLPAVGRQTRSAHVTERFTSMQPRTRGRCSLIFSVQSRAKHLERE